MNTHGDVDRRLADWLAEEAPSRAPGHLRQAIDKRLDLTPQRGVFPGLPFTLRTSRRWIPGAALVALLVAALGAGVWVAGSRSVNTAPSSSPVAGLAFTRAGELSSTGGVTLLDVVAARGGLIAVGSIGSDASRTGAAWTSADGASWTSVPSDTNVPVMTAVDGAGSTLVAIGPLCPPNPPPPDAKCRSIGGASLTSGGLHWQGFRWQGADATYGTPQFTGPGANGYGFLVNAVTAGGPGYVIVGSALKLHGTDVATSVGPAVATSADGATWTWRVLPVTQLSDASMTAVAAGPHGSVAVGTGVSIAEPTVWVSVDGSAWDRIPPTAAPRSGELDGVAASPAGYVAVGRDGASAAAWFSVDGRSWERSSPSVALDDAWMTRVVWTGTQFLAVGRTATGDGAAWLSSDGSTWTRLDTTGVFAGTPIIDGATLGPRLVLLGQDPAGHVVVAVADQR